MNNYTFNESANPNLKRWPLRIHPFVLVNLCKLAYKAAKEETNSQWEQKLPGRLDRWHASDVVIFRAGDTEGFAATIVQDDQKVRLYAWRGTETDRFRDLLADIKSAFRGNKVPSAFGSRTRVAGGFAAAMAEVWPQVAADLESRKDCKRIFLGHSLGGSLAAVCAAEAIIAGYGVDGLFTIGSPRIGNADYATILEERIKLNGEVCRVVNANDPVTSVPPSVWGFRHVGVDPWYFRASNATTMTGELIRPEQQGNGSTMFLDRVWAYWKNFFRLRLVREGGKRHSLDEYISLIKVAFRED